MTPLIDVFDLIGIIVQDFSSALGMAVRGHGFRITNELLVILTGFDESTLFCYSPNHCHTNNHGVKNNSNENQQHSRDWRKLNFNQD